MGPKRKATEAADVSDDNTGEGSSSAAPKLTQRQQEEKRAREKTEKYWSPAKVRDAALSKSDKSKTRRILTLML